MRAEIGPRGGEDDRKGNLQDQNNQHNSSSIFHNPNVIIPNSSFSPSQEMWNVDGDISETKILAIDISEIR